MDKKCETYERSDLLCYLQNRMSREEENEFQRHLMTCHHCREEVGRLRTIIHTLEHHTVMNRKQIWIAAATIALLIVGGITVTVWRNGAPSNSSSPLQYNPEDVHHNQDTVLWKDSVRVDSLSNH